MFTDPEKAVIEGSDVGGIAGFAIGVLYVATPFVFVPGNIQNATTLGFPVAYECAEGVSIAELLEGAKKVETALLSAAARLEKRGVRAIVGACGSFANFQTVLNSAVSVPVFSSVLTQIPWLLRMLPRTQRLAIIFADKRSFTAQVQAECCIDDLSRLVITDCMPLAPFRALIEQPYRIFHQELRLAVAEHARDLVRTHPDIGLVVLQCSELSPYASAIQAAAHRPVVDVVGLAQWVYSTVVRKPVFGYL
jgi:Asp/Glu/hydantoin racemase